MSRKLASQQIGWWLGIWLWLGVALAVRVIALPSFPSGFHHDEASFWLNTLYLKHTGLDEDGRSWPLFLNSFTDPKPAAISYLQLAASWVVGDSLWAARLPMALAGTMSIGCLLWLLHRWTQSVEFTWLAAAWFSLSPWHIAVSRGTQEVIVSFCLGVLSLVALEKAWDAAHNRLKNWKVLTWLGVMSLSFWLSLYIYHSAKLLLPVLVLFLGLWRLSEHQTAQKIVSVVAIGCAGIIACSFLLLGNKTLQRYKDINIFTTGPVLPVTIEQITLGTGKLPATLLRVLHNKPVNAAWQVAGTYFAHVSGQFLVVGGGQPQRMQLPQQGVLYFVELPLLLLGVAQVLGRRSPRVSALMLAWLAVAPLPAALTTDEVPSLIRSFWMVVPLGYLVCLGYWSLGRWLQAQKPVVQGLGLVVVSLTLTWNIAYFADQYLLQAPHRQPWYRNYADQVLAQQLQQLSPHYSKVVVSRFTSHPYTHLAIAGLIAPSTLQTTYPLRLAENYSLEKFYFVKQDCPLELEPNTLFAVRKLCALESIALDLGRGSGLQPDQVGTFTVQAEALYLDGNDGYVLVTYSPPDKSQGQ